MKLIHFFIIFTILIGASLGVTIIATKGEPSTLLYVAEGLCVVALLFLLYFYRKVMRPIKSISNDAESTLTNSSMVVCEALKYGTSKYTTSVVRSGIINDEITTTRVAVWLFLCLIF